MCNVSARKQAGELSEYEPVTVGGYVGCAVPKAPYPSAKKDSKPNWIMFRGGDE